MTVVMLDRETGILHRPSNQHLITLCGLGPLSLATVGPDTSIEFRSTLKCQECWRLNGQ